MERGICPIAVFYFALKHALSLTFKNVSMLPDFGSLDHKTRSGWFPIGGQLTPTHR